MSELELKPTTLRPGLLVALKTAIKGENVDYSVEEIEPDHATEQGGRNATWQTTRTIADSDEHEQAVKARSKARNLVCGVCAKSDFGLLCTEEKSGKLLEVIAQAQRVVDEFNESAKLTEITFNTLIGRVSPDDVLAVKAINSEIRELMQTMEEGIKKLDIEAARKAAARAKDMAAMLAPAASERVAEAVALTRKALKKINKAGEQAAEELSRDAIAALINARTAFLDLEPAADMPTEQPDSEGRAVDLSPESETEGESLSDAEFDGNETADSAPDFAEGTV